MKEIPAELREFITSLDKREFNLSDLETERETFLQLMRYGIILPYGDAFAYDGKAVLICGHSESGKSTLAQKFKRELGDRVKILSKDSSILYWNGRSNPVVYEDDINSIAYPFFIPFLFPGEAEEYELGMIIYLNPEADGGVIPINILDGAVSGCFIECHQPRTPELERILASALRNVPVFEYEKKHGPNREADLDIKYKDIISELNRLRK